MSLVAFLALAGVATAAIRARRAADVRAQFLMRGGATDDTRRSDTLRQVRVEPRPGGAAVLVPPDVTRQRMALSKLTEAVKPRPEGDVDSSFDNVRGEGATLRDVLRSQPDIVCLVNGTYFYFAKLDGLYGGTARPGHRAHGDPVLPMKVREHTWLRRQDSMDAAQAPEPRRPGPDAEDTAEALGSRPAGGALRRDRAGDDAHLSPIGVDDVRLPARYGYLCQERRGDVWTLRRFVDGNATRAHLARCKYAMTCSPVLVDGGAPCNVDDIATAAELESAKGPPGHLGHLCVPNPRSFIGVRADGTFVIASYRGRAADFDGLTLEGLQREALALGCVRAFNLDGGGSSQLYLEGKGVVVANELDRIIGNAVVLFR